MHMLPENVNAAGQVTGFRIHDAVVTAFSYEDGAELTLRVRRVDGTRARVVFRGVGEVGTNCFRAPAIISDIFAWSPSKTPPTALTWVHGAWNVFFAGELRAESLEKAVRGIISRNKHQHVVLVECSYGGVLAAMCNDIELIEEGEVVPE
jgi:hypothetical protein